MPGQLNGIHPTSRHASPARRNPSALDPREPTWHNASPGDIAKSTPPGVGLRHGVGDAAASGQADSPEAGLGRAARRVPDRILDFPGTGRAEDGATDTTVDDRTRSCPNRADDHPAADTPTNSCTPDPLDAATSILNLGRRLR